MNAAIIVAAGTGSRMNSATPKQFLPLDNEMVLTRTVRVFEESPEIQEIVLVVSPEWADFVKTEIVLKENYRTKFIDLPLNITGSCAARGLWTLQVPVR